MSRIQPLKPLDVGDLRYVPSPDGAGEAVAERIRRGLDPVLLVGHRGTGRSTELRRAAWTLAEEGPALVLDLADLGVPLRPERVLYDIADKLLQWWVADGPEQQPTPFLVQDLRASDPTFPQGQGRTLSASDMVRATLDELTLAAGVDKLPLLLDGVDSLPVDEARDLLLRLLALTERAQLAVVASPELAHGPANVAVLDRYRVVHASPVAPSEPEARAFLAEVARAHLGAQLGEDEAEPADTREVLPDEALDRIVHLSGGVVRDLLLLVKDAWAYADSETIDTQAVDAAVHDRGERLRRLLVAGDLAALEAADGTAGLEVPADRKIRLLQHGLLLEVGTGAAARVFRNPIIPGFAG